MIYTPKTRIYTNTRGCQDIPFERSSLLSKNEMVQSVLRLPLLLSRGESEKKQRTIMSMGVQSKTVFFVQDGQITNHYGPIRSSFYPSSVLKMKKSDCYHLRLHCRGGDAATAPRYQKGLRKYTSTKLWKPSTWGRVVPMMHKIDDIDGVIDDIHEAEGRRTRL